jgi:hypothetical protein
MYIYCWGFPSYTVGENKHVVVSVYLWLKADVVLLFCMFPDCFG